jgi:hypothetical protein
MLFVQRVHALNPESVSGHTPERRGKERGTLSDATPLSSPTGCKDSRQRGVKSHTSARLAAEGQGRYTRNEQLGRRLIENQNGS